MHELSLAGSILNTVLQHAGGKRISEVCIGIGPLACVERSALSFCWEAVSADSPAAGARLVYLAAEGSELTIRHLICEED